MYANFEKILKQKNLSSYKVAKEAGVTQTALSNWKNGKSTPSTTTLQKIAEYLGVTVDCLMNGEETDNKALNEKDERDIKQAIEDFKNRLSTAGRSPIRNGRHCFRWPKLTHASTYFCLCSSAAADRLRLWLHKVRTFSR